MKMKPFRIIPFFVFLFVGAAVFAQPKIKVGQGNEFNYSVTSNMIISMSAMGQDMKVTNSGTSTMKNRIEKVLEDGSFNILSGVWDVKSSANMIVKDTTIVINGKVGPSYRYQLSKNGKILKSEKADTATSPIGDNANFTNGFMKSGAFLELPAHTLTNGEKWTTETADSVDIGVASGKLGVKLKIEYTYTGSEAVDGKTFYKVTYKASCEIAGKSQMQGMDVGMEGSGEETGMAYLDPATGAIQQTSSNLEINVNMGISGQQAMSIPMNMKVELTQKRLI